MGKAVCSNKNLVFKTSEASTKSWFRTRGIINETFDILDFAKFVEENNKWSDYVREKFMLDGKIFTHKANGTKAVPNDKLFHQIDALKGIYYPDNNYLRGVPIKTIKPLSDILFEVPDMTRPSQENDKAIKVFNALGTKFEKSFGVPYDIINTADAIEKLSNTQTPYANQAAFYFNNKIYFVRENLSVGTMLHEYSHPLIKGIALNNKALFNNLYNKLTQSYTWDQLQRDLAKTTLEPGSDRYKEEALVRALTLDASNRVQKLTSTDEKFNDFINKILYAIKQIFKKLTKTLSLNELDANTTLEDLSKMLVEEDFHIDNLYFDESDYAEFSDKFVKLSEQLNNVEKDKLEEAINRAYVEARFQINQLRNTSWKLKDDLTGKNGMRILINIRDFLKSYQTAIVDPSKVSAEEVLDAVENKETEFRKRAVAIVNSLNEIKVFSTRIEDILFEMESTNKHLTKDGIAKLNYFKEFIGRQKTFMNDMSKILSLTRTNPIANEIRVIKDVLNTTSEKIKDLEKNLVIEFFTDKTEFMTKELEKRVSEAANRLMKSDGISQDKIDAFVEKIISNPSGKPITITDIELPLSPNKARTLLIEVNQYYTKRLNRETLTDYIEGRTEDIGFVSSLMNPYMSMDDPIGSYARYVKIKLSEAESQSLRQANDIASKLLPLLQEFGYNPNSTKALGDALLTVDRVGSTNKDGEFEDFEVYSFLQRYGNGWRADKARLQYNFDQARLKGNKEEIQKAVQDLWEFDAKYMTRKYKDSYYDKQKIWKEESEVVHPKTKEKLLVTKRLATEAFIEKQKAQDTMNMYKNREKGEGEDLQAFTTADAAKADYEALFNPYDVNGKIKTGDDLIKTLLRMKYRETTRGFYEYVTDESRVQEDIDEFIKDLEIQGITEVGTPDRFKDEMARYIKKNFRISYTEAYYKKRQDIFNQLDQLNKRTGGKSAVAQELADLYSQRFRLANQITDVNSITFGDRYSEEQRALMKDLEEKIVDLQTNYDSNSGLSREQLDRLDKYKEKLVNNIELTEAEDAEYTDLINIQNKLGLTPVEYQTQRDLLKELGELTTKEPTEYYLKTFAEMLGETTADAIDLNEIDKWINSPNLDLAMGQNPEFKKWFTQNHYKRITYDKKGNPKDTWTRTRLWTYIRPSNDVYYKRTKVINPITKKEYYIKGVPSSKYSYQKVKKEYRTGYNPTTGKVELRVGTEVDNAGNFLPNENATDRKYINQEYIDLEKNPTSTRFKLLNAITETMLDIQKGKPGSSKLYLDLPRMSIRTRSNLEYIQSGKVQENLSSRLDSVKEALSYFTGRKADDNETTAGINANIEMQLIQTDLQGQPIARVPVRGLYKLKRSDVSQDILRGMYDYLHSLNEQKMLIDEEPMAKAILNVMNDPENAIKNINKASKNIYENTGVYSFLPASDNRRKQAMEHFIMKTFYGQAYSAFGDENPMTTKVANMLMHAASRSFIAMDMVSAFKNRFGMIMQNSIESAAGTYYNPVTYAKGRIWSFEAVVQLMSKGIYSQGPKSLALQMMERFDPIIGKTKADFGKSTSRTFLKDFFDGTWMYDTRKLMEVEGGLQVFGGMMYNLQIDQKQADGSVKQIPYIEAFELDDQQQLKLKEGINPEWGPDRIEIEYKKDDDLAAIAKKYNMTLDELLAKNKVSDIKNLQDGERLIVSEASLFNDYKLKIQGVGKKLNGMSDQFGSPQGEKYLGYRLFMFYKKYATSMFLNRFQADMSKDNRWGHVYDWDMGTPTKGYYITAFQALTRGVRDMGAYWGVMSTEEKSAMKKVLTEGVYLAVLGIAAALLFGYDPGDEERFDKIKERQKNFGFYGYMGNHVLYQLIMVKRENESFIPLPMIGLDDWIKFGDTSTIVTGPTISLYTKILNDLYYMATGDEKGLYKQDAGPYPWQEEGRYKLWNHLAAIYGIKGKNYDPISAIKSAETFENLK